MRLLPAGVRRGELCLYLIPARPELPETQSTGAGTAKVRTNGWTGSIFFVVSPRLLFHPPRQSTLAGRVHVTEIPVVSS